MTRKHYNVRSLTIQQPDDEETSAQNIDPHTTHEYNENP